tara:strand:- start:609 stop:920 length:312 start_codon:yes stop_codon:yes gene_type:complete
MAKKDNYPTYDAGGRVKSVPYRIKTGTGEKTDKGYKSDMTISVPAEHVGGKKGEKRYYKGSGESSNLSVSRRKGVEKAKRKAIYNPSDSLTTKQYKDILKKIK